MYESLININKTLEDAIPKYIEAFVSFYGEEERENIENKFRSLITVGYLSIDDYRDLLVKLKRKCSLEALEEFKERTGIKEDNQISAIFGFLTDMEYVPLESFFKNLDNDNLRFLSENTVKEFYGSAISLDSEEGKRIIELFKKIYPEIEVVRARYKELFKQYEDYQKYYDFMLEYRDKLKAKYSDKYVDLIKDRVCESDRKIIDEGKFNNRFYSLKSRGIYFGSTDAFGKGFIESFLKEKSDELSNEDVSQENKEIIKNNRIAYFKMFGIKHDSYEEYMNDERCRELIPTEEFIQDIVKLKTKIRNEYENELTATLPHNAIGKNKLDSYPLMLGDYCFYKNTRKKINAIYTNYVREDGQVKLKPILFINGCAYVDSFDCVLAHELNHLYELNFRDFDGTNFKSVTGWDAVSESIDENTRIFAMEENEPPEEKREFEMLNEIINELIAQDICDILHNNGVYIVGNKEISYSSSGTNYEELLRAFTLDFYREFKEYIIKSRKDYNIDLLFDVVGEDNFRELNNLINEYKDYFKGLKIIGLHTKLKNNVIDQDVEYHNECIRKKNEILEKMRSNKVKYEERNKIINK